MCSHDTLLRKSLFILAVSISTILRGEVSCSIPSHDTVVCSDRVDNWYCRQYICLYMEQIKIAYNTKDISFLEQVFLPNGAFVNDRQGAQKYIRRLKKLFATTTSVKYILDDFKIQRHSTKPDLYGLTLYHGYTSNRHCNGGYMFLMWDFTDKLRPAIRICTWQPDKRNGERIPKDDVFGLNDFDI